MMNDKYVVWKRSDVEEFFEGMGEDGVHCGGSAGIFITDFADRALPDAEVIRHQDITSAPLFHQYASNIKTVIELALRFGIPLDTEGLMHVADHFHQAALAAEEHPSPKLPD